MLARRPTSEPTPSAPLQWHEEYESGDTLIDQQHRWLFHGVNSMRAAIDAGDARRACEILDEIVGQVIGHFHDEEALLAQRGYPEFEQHQRRHVELLDRLLTHRNEVAGDVSRMAPLVEFLVDEVVVNHLLRADRLYFDCLRG
jgi:hemerythrin-like metal-binding protein